MFHVHVHVNTIFDIPILEKKKIRTDKKVNKHALPVKLRLSCRSLRTRVYLIWDQAETINASAKNIIMCHLKNLKISLYSYLPK